MEITGIHALLRLLADRGVRYIFGNPGTTELPLSDALVEEPRIRYILGLQEVSVMAMADGYAMASRSLGVVNVHISCGLGNAMGMLYNAFREGTPLLLTAGQQDRRLKLQEPILWGDMVSVVRPWTKWAMEVERIEDLPMAVKRAMNIALTPPTGPVFLSIPLDLQMQEAELDLTPAPLVGHHVRPPALPVAQAADLLVDARNPAILVGSRVQEAQAVSELVSLAERLGAPVFSEPPHAHGRLSFPADHPLYGQTVPLWAHEISAKLAEFDVLLVAGMDLLREYIYHGPQPAIPSHLRVIHIDEDAYQLGKNFYTEVGLLGHTKTCLFDLDRAVAERLTHDLPRLAAERGATRQKSHEAARTKLREQIAARRDARPMHPSVLMESIAGVLSENVAVIEEAVTTTGTILERLGALKNTDGYFAHRGWALGWGLGCALGVKLAWPDRPVLAILGEGAAMYGIQGLWAAAHHKLNVTFVIANNAQYQILKSGAAGLGLPHAKAGKFVGMDLMNPQIDFVALAQSLGVQAERVTEPTALAEKVGQSLAAGDAPRLFDVPIERSLAGPT